MKDDSLTFQFASAGAVTCCLRADALTVRAHDACASLQLSQPANEARDELQLRIVDLDGAGAVGDELLLAGLLTVFHENEQLQVIRVAASERSVLRARLHGLGASAAHGELTCIERGSLYQHAAPFLRDVRAPFPERFVLSDGKRHPQRPPKPCGELYRRRIADLDCEFTARTIDPAADLTVFHRWMNDPRVSAFWEQAGSLDEQAAYLDKVTRDPHNLPVLGCFDGEPFGYFELYWAKEDRIGPFYRADDYDRGLHMLVGEPRHRGAHRVKAWLSSLVHYLFLDDPRTRAVVAEPRSDNAKMIAYLRERGFYQEKLFDFPHKRAAMMILPRETFFAQYCP